MKRARIGKGWKRARRALARVLRALARAIEPRRARRRAKDSAQLGLL